MTRGRAHRLIQTSRSRRAFLRGAGGVVVGLPFLELTAPRSSHAQVSAGPKRLMIMSLGHSMDVESGTQVHFIPESSGGALTAMSPILEALTPHMSKVSFLGGIDNLVAQALASNGHNASGRTVLGYSPHHGAAFESDGSLSGDQENNAVTQIHEDPPTPYPIGPSIHLDIAKRLGVSALNLRVGGDHGEHARDFYESTDTGGNTIIQRDPGTPDPSAAFDNLFGAVTGEVEEPTARERLRAKRGSVLDSVLTDFNRVIGEVGAADRERLERHADHIRQIESSITNTVNIVCDDPALSLPAGMPNNLTDGNGRFDDLIAQAQFGLIGTAFACQATPVAHLHFSNIQVNKFPFLNDGVDMFESGDDSVNWHAAVHHDDGDSPEANQRRLVAMTWYGQLLADLIDTFEAIPEGEGSLMDNTLIVWISSLRHSSHSTSDLPVVLAGTLGGALNGGRFHDFADHGTGATLGDLWASIGNIMLMDDLSNGWTDAPLAGFGFDTGTGRNGRSFQNGPLPGLLAGT